MTDKTTFLAGSTLPEIPESAALADPIAFLTKFASPFLLAIGFPGSVVIAENPHHEWNEEALNPDSATLADATLSAAATTINVTTGQGSRFNAGDIVQFNGSRELISVTSISTDALTVVRAIRGTTGETQVIGDVLEILNNPALEAETSPAARPTSLARGDNYTEIYRDAVAVTRSMRKSKQFGNIRDQLDHQVLRVKQSLLRKIARNTVRGARQTTNPQGTTTATRTQDGFIQLLLNGSDASVVDAATAALDEDLINQVLEDAFTKGGTPRLIATSPKQKRKLSKLMEGRVRYEGDDHTLGVVVDRFMSDFGTLDVLEADIFIPNDAILFVDRSKANVAKLGEDGDPFEVDDLGKDGLVDDAEVVTELTLELKNAGDGGHGLLHNLSVA